MTQKCFGVNEGVVSKVADLDTCPLTVQEDLDTKRAPPSNSWNANMVGREGIEPLKIR
jgi:hypothetical protein